jgi:hypothetical protein
MDPLIPLVRAVLLTVFSKLLSPPPMVPPVAGGGVGIVDVDSEAVQEGGEVVGDLYV